MVQVLNLTDDWARVMVLTRKSALRRENEILHFGLRRCRLPENSVASTMTCTRYRMEAEGATNNVFHGVMVSIPGVRRRWLNVPQISKAEARRGRVWRRRIRGRGNNSLLATPV
jgi:hypothetical protein